MVDPIAALGVAGNVVQFVQFASEVISEGKRIYRSGDGTASDNHDLEIVTSDLILLQSKIAKSTEGSLSNDAPGEEVALRRICEVANELATKLLQKLNSVKAEGRHRRWDSFRQALKTVWSQKDIDRIAERLSKVQNDRQLQVLVGLK